MWLSEQMRAAPTGAEADLGVTTIAGGRAGVLTRGEVRSLPVYGPGGYVWQPADGQRVLVIKGGPGGEEHCVAGAGQDRGPEGMQPGEVYIFTRGGASVYLRADGRLELKGDIRLSGNLVINGEAYRPCRCEGG